MSRTTHWSVSLQKVLLNWFSPRRSWPWGQGLCMLCIWRETTLVTPAEVCPHTSWAQNSTCHLVHSNLILYLLILFSTTLLPPCLCYAATIFVLFFFCIFACLFSGSISWLHCMHYYFCSSARFAQQFL